MTLTRWRDLEVACRAACRHFALSPVTLRPVTHPRARCYGFYADGVVAIRVHRLGRPSVPLAWGTVLDTLAHELAHHALGHAHGPAHRQLTAEILAYVRSV